MFLRLLAAVASGSLVLSVRVAAAGCGVGLPTVAVPSAGVRRFARHVHRRAACVARSTKPASMLAFFVRRFSLQAASRLRASAARLALRFRSEPAPDLIRGQAYRCVFFQARARKVLAHRPCWCACGGARGARLIG